MPKELQKVWFKDEIYFSLDFKEIIQIIQKYK